MSNAVSELALLKSGQVIPAEFWPGHESHFLNNDLHRPWWERVSGDVLLVGNENEFTLSPLDMLMMKEESAEYSERLSRRKSSLPQVFKDEGNVLFLATVTPCNEATAAAAEMETDSYVSKGTKAESSPRNIQFSGKIPLLRQPRKRVTKKSCRRFDSHGKWGRTRKKYELAVM